LTAHVFVDESKKSGFLIAAALVLPEDLQTTRKAMRGLCLPNQRRIHFKDEKQPRKKKILEVIASTGVTARVYVGPERVRELAARKACLDRLSTRSPGAGLPEVPGGNGSGDSWWRRSRSANPRCPDMRNPAHRSSGRLPGSLPRASALGDSQDRRAQLQIQV
jgi:hypothetical protein